MSTLQILIEPSQLELTTVLPALSRSTLSTGAVWPSRLTVAKVEVFITWNASIQHRVICGIITLTEKSAQPATTKSPDMVEAMAVTSAVNLKIFIQIDARKIHWPLDYLGPTTPSPSPSQL